MNQAMNQADGEDIAPLYLYLLQRLQTMTDNELSALYCALDAAAKGVWPQKDLQRIAEELRTVLFLFGYSPDLAPPGSDLGEQR